jgi:hypothetical protein
MRLPLGVAWRQLSVVACPTRGQSINGDGWSHRCLINKPRPVGKASISTPFLVAKASRRRFFVGRESDHRRPGRWQRRPATWTGQTPLPPLSGSAKLTSRWRDASACMRPGSDNLRRLPSLDRAYRQSATPLCAWSKQSGHTITCFGGGTATPSPARRLQGNGSWTTAQRSIAITARSCAARTAPGGERAAAAGRRHAHRGCQRSPPLSPPESPP